VCYLASVPKALDITGERYGRLTGVEVRCPRNKNTFWLFRCECGTEKEIDLGHVRKGRVVSCGCYLLERLRSPDHREKLIRAAKAPRRSAHWHGMSKTPVHSVWKAMHERCRNPNSRDYRWYGAKGVTVCERWRDFKSFYADMGEPNGLTLDRIDPAGNYEPSNCRWATWEVQRGNKRARG